MTKEMNLTAQEIFEKEFHVDIKGYAPAEVDEFLDLIIEDYQVYDELGQALSRYEEKIKELQQEIYTLQSENQNLNEKVSADYVNGNTDMIDLLKRIARLEQAVFHTTNSAPVKPEE